jgi:tRNA-binding protein
VYTPDEPRKPDVGADAFFALDLRVGRVVKVEDFPAARNPAYKMTVDFGPAVGELTTSAQAAHYPKEELEGRLVVGAINLGEKKIAGFRSQFLVLGSFDADGKVRLLQPEDGTAPGSPIA